MMGTGKVTVVTPGRFHAFDLAEQLQRSGKLAAIYTGYPLFKLHNTSVDPRSIRSIPWLITPFMVMAGWRFIPRRAMAELEWYGKVIVERAARRTLPECDLVIAMSSIGLSIGGEIQRRGGRYVCDRGSTHIEVQERLLAAEYAKLGMRWCGIERRVIDKELAEYALADAITLPSRFTVRSFVEMGVPAEKLRQVPYGVNLTRFARTAERASNFRILFAGQLSVRKGLHYLLDAFQKAALPDAELILAGPHTSDTAALLRRNSLRGVSVMGALDRARLVQEMSRASVMVLPSIEEGLALVLAQAMACGCPVIGSVHTGIEDLVTDGKEGFIVPPYSVEALVERLTVLYRDRELVESMSESCRVKVKALGGWDSYGRTMMGVIDGLLGGPRRDLGDSGAAR
jgi:glycosyltransferase involved in cell wall biosynthesis